MHKQEIYRIVNEKIAAIPPTVICPVFSPFLMGTNVHPNAKASFVGISSFHRRDHLLRSVYEGIVFFHKFHFGKLMKTRTAPFDCIRLAGGAAKSDVWAQMFADVMEVTVETVDISEAGAMGCAMAAAVAAGEYQDYREAADKMVRVRGRYTPYENNFEIYRKKVSVVSGCKSFSGSGLG